MGIEIQPVHTPISPRFMFLEWGKFYIGSRVKKQSFWSLRPMSSKMKIKRRYSKALSSASCFPKSLVSQHIKNVGSSVIQETASREPLLACYGSSSKRISTLIPGSLSWFFQALQGRQVGREFIQPPGRWSVWDGSWGHGGSASSLAGSCVLLECILSNRAPFMP